MSRLFRFACVGAFVCATGCSGDPPTPPTTAASVDAVASQPSSLVNPEIEVITEAVQGADPKRVATVAEQSPEAAMRALLDGWGANNPEALWDALPPSYQRDINDLVQTMARRLHPEAWQWFLKVARKGSIVFEKHAAGLTQVSTDSGAAGDGPDVANVEMNADVKFTADGCTMLASFLTAIGDSGADTLERLQTADVGRLLQGKGRPLVGQFRKLLQGSLEDKVFVAGFIPAVDPSEIRVVLKSASGDYATVELVYGEEKMAASKADEPEDNAAFKLLKGLVETLVPDDSRLTVALVRVEGKWIPRWLANRWMLTVSSLQSALLEAMPSESPRENFGTSFHFLTALETQLKLWETLRDEPPEAIPAPFWYTLISPEFGPGDLVAELGALLVEGFLEDDGYEEMSAPAMPQRDERRCDFERTTHKALDEKGKRVVVLTKSTADTRASYPVLDGDVVGYVSELLMSQHVDAVDPERVAEWATAEGGLTDDADLVKIAATLKADFLVIIKFDELGCRADGGEKWIRGHARGTLTVTEVVAADDEADRKTAQVIYTRPFESRYPAHLPVSAEDEPKEKFQRRFLQDLVDTLTRLLLDVDDESKPPQAPPRA